MQIKVSCLGIAAFVLHFFLQLFFIALCFVQIFGTPSPTPAPKKEQELDCECSGAAWWDTATSSAIGGSCAIWGECVRIAEQNPYSSTSSFGLRASSKQAPVCFTTCRHKPTPMVLC